MSIIFAGSLKHLFRLDVRAGSKLGVRKQVGHLMEHFQLMRWQLRGVKAGLGKDFAACTKSSSARPFFTLLGN